MQPLAGALEPFTVFRAFFPPADQLFRFVGHQLDEFERLLEVEDVRAVGDPPGQISLFTLRHRSKFTASCVLSPMSFANLLDPQICGAQFLGELIGDPFQTLDCHPRRLYRFIGLSSELRAARRDLDRQSSLNQA